MSRHWIHGPDLGQVEPGSMVEGLQDVCDHCGCGRMPSPKGRSPRKERRECAKVRTRQPTLKERGTEKPPKDGQGNDPTAAGAERKPCLKPGKYGSIVCWPPWFLLRSLSPSTHCSWLCNMSSFQICIFEFSFSSVGLQ